MYSERLYEAAKIVAQVVPGVVDDDGELRILNREEQARLSTCERAAYDLTLDLFSGQGVVGIYCLHADQRFAGVLVAALTVAVGEQLVPLES